MSAKTTHVLPAGGRWIVKKPDGKTTGAYPTEREARDVALRLTKASKEGQVVIHSPAGFTSEALHGLPKVQPPPRGSKLGKNAIKKAVSKVVRARLADE